MQSILTFVVLILAAAPAAAQWEGPQFDPYAVPIENRPEVRRLTYGAYQAPFVLPLDPGPDFDVERATRLARRTMAVVFRHCPLAYDRVYMIDAPQLHQPSVSWTDPTPAWKTGGPRWRWRLAIWPAPTHAWSVTATVHDEGGVRLAFDEDLAVLCDTTVLTNVSLVIDDLF